MTLSRLARVGLPTGAAIVFWVVNAGIVGRRLGDAGMVRAFFWNMLLFAVVVTSLNAAGVAWVGRGFKSMVDGPRSQTALALSSILAAFAVAVVGLACGIGVTCAIISRGLDSHMWGMFAQGLRLIVPLGLVFSVIGAITGDLGSNLAAMLTERTTPKMGPGLIVMLVVAHLLWVGVAWVALASLRGHMPGA
jgi:hypothetical protein